jgi:2-C-methyl-D-erythritol 4-phosphate cytidylyltransferase
VREAGVAALIAAAGRGERLGKGPKAFVEVGGRTLVGWVLAALTDLVEEIVVAVPEGQRQRLLDEHPGVRVEAGGATRQATVAALARATRCPVVLVHDAARPFLDAATVRTCLAAAREHGAASAAMPVADTLVDVATGERVDRDRLRAVQTPQAFWRSWLLEAHAAAAAAGVEATDDAGLVRWHGRPVRLVAGGTHLFKVTNEADLALARAYAAALRPLEPWAGG